MTRLLKAWRTYVYTRGDVENATQKGSYSRITFTLVLGYDVVIYVLGNAACIMPSP